jgi:hypothetical protein
MSRDSEARIRASSRPCRWCAENTRFVMPSISQVGWRLVKDIVATNTSIFTPRKWVRIGVNSPGVIAACDEYGRLVSDLPAFVTHQPGTYSMLPVCASCRHQFRSG